MDSMDTALMGELGPSGSRSSSVILLLTTGDSGAPGVCLLSPYQVVASGPRALLFAVYAGSRTVANLEKRKKATVVVFLPPAAYYVQGEARKLDRSPSKVLGENVHFRLSVSAVTRDFYSRAPITSSPAFDESQVLEKYREVYSELAESVKSGRPN